MVVAAGVIGGTDIAATSARPVGRTRNAGLA
jgi:hypothetical protein